MKRTRITDYGSIEVFHDNPDRPGEYVVEKIFDREPILDECARMRNEVDQRGRELKLEMKIPITLFYQWLRDGTLSPNDCLELPNGGMAIDPRKLERLKREHNLLRCD